MDWRACEALQWLDQQSWPEGAFDKTTETIQRALRRIHGIDTAITVDELLTAEEGFSGPELIELSAWAATIAPNESPAETRAILDRAAERSTAPVLKTYLQTLAV